MFNRVDNMNPFRCPSSPLWYCKNCDWKYRPPKDVRCPGCGKLPRLKDIL